MGEFVTPGHPPWVPLTPGPIHAGNSALLLDLKVVFGEGWVLHFPTHTHTHRHIHTHTHAHRVSYKVGSLGKSTWLGLPPGLYLNCSCHLISYLDPLPTPLAHLYRLHNPPPLYCPKNNTACLQTGVVCSH